jgi:hypothetical protein
MYIALKFCATSLIFKTIPKVNSYPIGENPPNLVTLVAGWALGSPAPQRYLTVSVEEPNQWICFSKPTSALEFVISFTKFL